MRYVVGVDGGQTSTAAVVLDETGRLLGAGQGGPANHVHESGGVERVRRSVADAIHGARAAAGLLDAPLAFAYLGMTGGSARMEEICQPAVDADGMSVGHDSLIALYSVTWGQPGVVVIGGTGSVGFGRDTRGRTVRAGGWGYLLGDEGSGYWIAMRALNVCVRAHDGLGLSTSLQALLPAKLEADGLAGIHRMIYSGRLTRPDIAALSAVVADAAEQGDRVAQHILGEAGRELGRLAAAVLRAFRWRRTPVVVGTVGGVFRAGPRVLVPFTRVVQGVSPAASIVAPRIPAVVAAGLLALEQIGAAVDDDVVGRVMATLPALDPVKV